MIKTLRQKYHDLMYVRYENILDHNNRTRSTFRKLVKNVVLLINEKTLTTIDMIVLVDDSNELMDYLNDYLSKEDFILISATLLQHKDEMLEDCLDLELYEGCTNINKFYDLFYRTPQNTTDV